MINSITIKNFQNHKNTTIEFCDGANVLIGKSDSGKSSILRALLWVVFNRPGGDSFVSHWGGVNSRTCVYVGVDDKMIMKERRKGKSIYTISGGELKKPIVFKAFGMGVPDEVRDLLNISEINIQRQLDAPFLFSKTPGEIGKVLNKTVNLEVIDKSQTNISKMLREEQRSFNNVKDTINTKKDSLKGYNWLVDADKKLSLVEALDGRVVATVKTVTGLTSVINQASVIRDEINNKKSIQYEDQVNQLITLDETTETKTNKYNDLCDAINEILLINKDMKTLNKLIKNEESIDNLILLQEKTDKVININHRLSSTVAKIKQIDNELGSLGKLIKNEESIDNLILLQEKTDKVTDRHVNLSNVCSNIIGINNNLFAGKSTIDDLESKFVYPDNICPLCNQEVKK